MPDDPLGSCGQRADIQMWMSSETVAFLANTVHFWITRRTFVEGFWKIKGRATQLH